MDHPMEKRVMVALTALCLAAASFIVPACAYTNHTVGGTAGWFFDYNDNTCATDYTKWAASQTFQLGDYLIFHTNTITTVVQTYNATTYGLCSPDEDSSNSTAIYYDNSNSTTVDPMVAEVPLTVEGLNYYFDYTGNGTAECASGMRFKITVAHGQGLPPDLSNSPPSSVSSAPPVSGDSSASPVSVTSPAPPAPNGGSISSTPRTKLGNGVARRAGGGARTFLPVFAAVVAAAVGVLV